MKNLKPCIFGLILSGCFAHTQMMTEENYATVQMGELYTDVEKKVGEPYAVRHIGQNTYEIEYIERIRGGGNLVAENHFFLTVEDGKVVNKRYYQYRPPGFETIYSDEPNFTPS